MSFRILLPIATYPDSAPQTAFQKVLELAGRLGAEVTVLVHEVDIPPIANPIADLVIDVQSMAAAAEGTSRARAQALREAIKGLGEGLGLPIAVETLRHERPAGQPIATMARTYDFTFLPIQPRSPDHALLAQDVMFGSGGPVIIFPADEFPCHLDKIAVAWDGGRAAARAIRDALPVLARAGEVVVLTSAEDKPIPVVSNTGLTAWLAAHSVGSRIVSVPLGGQKISDALQAAAIAQGAGLLVMGAYGHSRFREFVLGGATAGVLYAPRLPLFMSH